eukprot:225477_1
MSSQGIRSTPGTCVPSDAHFTIHFNTATRLRMTQSTIYVWWLIPMAVGIMQAGGSSLWHSSPLNLRPFYIAQNIAKRNATSRSTRLLIQKQLNESNQSPGTRCVTNDGSKYIEDNLKPSNHSLNAS